MGCNGPLCNPWLSIQWTVDRQCHMKTYTLPCVKVYHCDVSRVKNKQRQLICTHPRANTRVEGLLGSDTVVRTKGEFKIFFFLV